MKRALQETFSGSETNRFLEAPPNVGMGVTIQGPVLVGRYDESGLPVVLPKGLDHVKWNMEDFMRVSITLSTVDMLFKVVEKKLEGNLVHNIVTKQIHPESMGCSLFVALNERPICMICRVLKFDSAAKALNFVETVRSTQMVLGDSQHTGTLFWKPFIKSLESTRTLDEQRLFVGNIETLVGWKSSDCVQNIVIEGIPVLLLLFPQGLRARSLEYFMYWARDNFVYSINALGRNLDRYELGTSKVKQFAVSPVDT